MKAPRPGNWIAVPLPSGGYVLGLIARRKHGRMTQSMFCYFFGPRRLRLEDVRGSPELKPTDRIAFAYTSDRGIKVGRWTVVGALENFDMAKWPMPPGLGIILTQRPEIGLRTLWAYDDLTLEQSGPEETRFVYDPDKYPQNARFGYIAMENELDARVARSEAQASYTHPQRPALVPMNLDALFDLARLGAPESPNRVRRVGAAIALADGGPRIVACNTFPRGVADLEWRHEGDGRFVWMEHAERNAIFAAARAGRSLEGATIASTFFPCIDCARAIVQTGIVRLVTPEPALDDPVWGAAFPRSRAILEEGGVTLVFVAPPPA